MSDAETVTRLESPYRLLTQSCRNNLRKHSGTDFRLNDFQQCSNVFYF